MDQTRQIGTNRGKVYYLVSESERVQYDQELQVGTEDLTKYPAIHGLYYSYVRPASNALGPETMAAASDKD